MPSIPEEPEQGELERLSMPDFLRPLQDLEVGLAKEAMLECQVTGLPYPAISWFHNGHRIQSGDDRRMTQCMCPGGGPGQRPLQHPSFPSTLGPSFSSLVDGGVPGGGEPKGTMSSLSLHQTHTAPSAESPLWPQLRGSVDTRWTGRTPCCRLWASYGAPLCLSFFIYNRRIMIIKSANTCKALRAGTAR